MIWPPEESGGLKATVSPGAILIAGGVVFSVPGAQNVGVKLLLLTLGIYFVSLILSAFIDSGETTTLKRSFASYLKVYAKFLFTAALWLIIESRSGLAGFFPRNAGSMLQLSSAAPSGAGSGRSTTAAMVASISTRLTVASEVVPPEPCPASANPR